MTISYRLTLETTSAVHCAATRASGGAAETLTYLPGSALRGALAARFLQRVAAEDAAFQRFTTEVRVGNALPATAAAPSAPAPLSAVSCSRAPGFRADGGDGVSDLLLLAEALSLRQGTVSDEASVATMAEPVDAASLLSCAHGDGERRRAGAIAPWQGYVSWQEETPRGAAVQLAAIITRRLGDTRRVSSGAAAYRRAMAAGQRFAAVADFPDEELANAVTGELGPAGTTLWVGADRSRGLGAVAVVGWERQEVGDDIAERRAGLEGRLRAWCEQAQVAAPEDGRYFALTLRSPAILRDAFGRCRQGLDGAALAALCELPGEALTVRQAFVGTTTVEGWNAALGLPKPDSLALAAGSCWLVRANGVDAAALDAALARLGREGVGERRQEGFGALTCCDPFHWRVHELDLEWERTP